MRTLVQKSVSIQISSRRVFDSAVMKNISKFVTRLSFFPKFLLTKIFCQLCFFVQIQQLLFCLIRPRHSTSSETTKNLKSKLRD
eukprot:UN32245